MVTYNREEVTLRCIRALREKTARPFTLTVVDNKSAPAMRENLLALHDEKAIDRLFFNGRNMGVSVAANLGWALSIEEGARWYLKMDNDILVKSPGWLDHLVSLAEEGGFGAVAYKLCSWHETTGATLPSGLFYHKTEAVNGGCILLPSQTHDALGFWNEDYLYGWEDLEYGNRLGQAEGKMAYAISDDMVEHLGPEADRQIEGYQEGKNKMAAETKDARSLFLLNMAMFEMGLRPLKVERKFLPDLSNPLQVTYRSNPAYRQIITRQNLFRQRFIKGQDGGDIFLNLPDNQ